MVFWGSMKFKNLTPIPNKVITQMGKRLKLKWKYPVIILEDPTMQAVGVMRFDEATEICFIFLQDGSDRSSLNHELRHLWQMEQMGPEVCRIIYEMEQKLVGYDQNTLELDAFEWEKKYRY
jgi:hypothetical protein